MVLKIRAPRPVEIELNAVFGSFQAPNSHFRVRFASTFANSTRDGHRELLKELLPMRDRVAASSLTDLSALLQRDLNDRRVAQKLIPYLLGDTGDLREHIGFFPAILAVLVPRGYLVEPAAGAEAVTRYPRPEAVEARVAYLPPGSSIAAWTIEQAVDEATSAALPLGILKINLSETEIVVLDGQHRSNAFRYLANAFDPTNQIYADFYRGVERPSSFASDLPVTIVWFEADAESVIEPRLIARRLFVDVNNTPQRVSSARTILLDDRSVTALATQSVYNAAAQAGFDLQRFSLFHSAFDMDSDLAGASPPAVALTTPDIIEAACLWLLLGTDTYSSTASWNVNRLRAQRNSARFGRVVGRVSELSFEGDEEENSVIVTSNKASGDYRREFDQKIAPVVLKLFSQTLSLLSGHYAAAAATQAWVVDADTPIEYQTTWTKLFLGGEGLYWTFKDSTIGRDNPYRRASAAIEREFRKLRAHALGLDLEAAESVFKSYTTKAFQIGFVMAADFLLSRGVGETLSEAAEELVGALERFSPSEWAALFMQVRPLLITSETNPRSWPTYRNLLVRMVSPRFFGADILGLPEVKAYLDAVVRAAERRAEDYPDPPEPDELSRAAREIWLEVSAAFEAAGLEVEDLVCESALQRASDHYHFAFRKVRAR